MADPPEESAQEVEREAMFFAVLRERTRPVDPLSRPAELSHPAELAPPDDMLRHYEEADREISEWLDEAEEEGGRILEQARADAARLRLEAHEQAERLRQAAERAAGEATRNRDRIVRQAEADVARAEATAHARAAEVMREAADKAADIYATRVEQAEREADWVRTQAESDARAAQSYAAATVQALQADVGTLQEQLAALVEHASQLLPVLDAAAQSLALGPAEAPTYLEAPAPVALDAPDVAEERGLGRLVEPMTEETFDDDEVPEPESTGTDEPAPTVVRRRPLGRLLRRTEGHA